MDQQTEKHIKEQVERLEGVEYIQTLLTSTNLKTTVEELLGPLARERARLDALKRGYQQLQALRERQGSAADPLANDAIQALEQTLAHVACIHPLRRLSY